MVTCRYTYAVYDSMQLAAESPVKWFIATIPTRHGGVRIYLRGVSRVYEPLYIYIYIPARYIYIYRITIVDAHAASTQVACVF